MPGTSKKQQVLPTGQVLVGNATGEDYAPVVVLNDVYGQMLRTREGILRVRAVLTEDESAPGLRAGTWDSAPAARAGTWD